MLNVNREIINQLADGKYCAWEALAKKFNVSYAGIGKNIQSLQGLGVIIR